MKKYLFIALAALGFAACAEKMDDNSPVQKGELEESYIAINLMSADVDTRAEDGGLEYGTNLERQITTAHFFFFDENGNPFNVVNAPATAPGGGQNHLQLDIRPITQSGNPVVNVSDISNAVLILNTYKGIYPKQIVAVLNWTPTAQKSYSLSDLHKVLEGTLGNDANGYVMSNSVYMDAADKMVDAVPLTNANIKTSADEAKNAPVDIYVERTAAKVAVISNSNAVESDPTIFKVSPDGDQFHPIGEGSGIDVYMQLLGWELYNDYSTSTLLKNIENWDIDQLGLNWNDRLNFRCYWANSQSSNHNDKFAWSYTDEDKTSNGFQTNYGFNVASDVNYTNRTTYTYCGENTNGEQLRTKVILKGQLKEKKGDGSYSALEIASWYGNDYAGVPNLKIAVANSLKYTLVYDNPEGDNYIGIEPADLEITDLQNIESYQVGFKLSTDGENKEWYLRSSDGGVEYLGDLSEDNNVAKTNEYLAQRVAPALVYTNGQTYYHIDIEHLGNSGTTAEFGVVRNHVYQISINSIKGYGSPVYNGFASILTPPEYPEEYDDTYVAARINVLSWKVVQQGVNIVQ